MTCPEHQQPAYQINLQIGQPTLICAACPQTAGLISYQRFKETVASLLICTSQASKVHKRFQQILQSIFSTALKKIQSEFKKEQQLILKMSRHPILFKNYKKDSQQAVAYVLGLGNIPRDQNSLKMLVKEITELPVFQPADDYIHLHNIVDTTIKHLQSQNFLPINIKIQTPADSLLEFSNQLRSKLLKYSKDYAYSYKKRGDKLYQLKNFQDALDFYSKAISLDDTNQSTFNRRGNCYHHINQFSKAIQDFQKAIAIKPDYSKAFYNHANSLRKLKKYSQAIQSFNKALALTPDHVDSLINKGVTLKNLKLYADAIKCYESALSINSQQHTAHYNKCLCLIKLGKMQQAQQSINKALQLQPSNGKYRQQKTQLTKKRGVQKIQKKT